MRLASTLRLLAALAVIAAVVATTLDTAVRSAINPFNFFGYFTIQSNLIAAAVYLFAAIAGFAGRRPTPALQLARGCATTYLLIVGVVYNLLLAGLAGGVELVWANVILHVVLPIYAAVDWLFFADREALPWRRFWITLVYPAVWLVVVLARGAIDGWVPYPFLDPANGYGSVAVYALAIAAGFGAFGVLVWALSRVRIGAVRPR